MSDASDTQALRGRKILVIEDEAILALDLALTIEEEGGSVEGPLYRLDHAMLIPDLQSLDAALLDVDIYGREVFPFADRLAAQDVPIVFHTGRSDIARLRRRYPDAPILRKPSSTRKVVESLTHVIARLRQVAVRGVAAS